MSQGSAESAVQQAIAAMVRRIVERFHPEKVILFGSHARGEATADSDVDLLVVARSPGTRRELGLAIDLALADIEVPKDVLVVTPEELERDRDIVGTVVHPAVREGLLLYDRAA